MTCSLCSKEEKHSVPIKGHVVCLACSAEIWDTIRGRLQSDWGDAPEDKKKSMGIDKPPKTITCHYCFTDLGPPPAYDQHILSKHGDPVCGQCVADLQRDWEERNIKRHEYKITLEKKPD